MHWTGFDFSKPQKSHLEQLNEKQRECAALREDLRAREIYFDQRINEECIARDKVIQLLKDALAFEQNKVLMLVNQVRVLKTPTITWTGFDDPNWL